MPDQLLRDVQSFEAELGLPQGFYLKLFDEDDWSFVIKLNALFEAACTHALVARLRAPEIESQLAHLELAGSDTGKVKFLAALGAITSEQASYLRKLAELRNDLVHNISAVAFTFEHHVAAMDRNQREQFVKVFGRCWADPVELHGKKIPRSKFVLENAKLSVWFVAVDVLGCLYLERELSEIRWRTAILDGYENLVQQ